MAKNKRKKTKPIAKPANISADIKIVIVIIFSILLAVLIYTESGYIGETLSPMLGGICGLMKYIVPIGTFGVAIYLACDDKKYIKFHICLAFILAGALGNTIDRFFLGYVRDFIYFNL